VGEQNVLSRTICFASFNLNNLNESGLPMYGTTGGWDQPTLSKKVAWRAKMLSRAQADVFGFQELWHENKLNRAVQQARLATDYEVLKPAGHY
jgi:hypothetical protein